MEHRLRLTLSPPAGRWSLAQQAIGVAGALVVSTAVVAVLQRDLHLAFVAPVYLLAVLATGMAFGTAAAVVTSVASFLLYDFFFVLPYYTLTVADPDEWLNLLLFLAVAVVIGRLAALLSERALESAERAREAQALFNISRALATSRTMDEAAPTVLTRLAPSTKMQRIWLGAGPSVAEERIVADTEPGAPLPVPAWHVVLQRAPGDEPARWVRTHVATGPERRRGPGAATVYRIRIEMPGEVLGSLWALRELNHPEPDRAETRILSAAADQLGQAIRRDRLTAEATAAEVARQSDALKSALLDSVSHDLRTPLATIRAAAGTLLDPLVRWSPDDQRTVLKSIDLEAERLHRLVRNLLDLSRIEGGALHPDLEAHDLDELVSTVVDRMRAATQKRLLVDVPPDLPPVLVDDLYLEQILVNLLENAVRYGGETIRLSARPSSALGGGERGPGESGVDLIVEDDGAGVPESALPRLFEKFYRVRRPDDGSRRGMGVGLTVVQGLVRAIGGDVRARPSELGGLAVVVHLRAAASDEEAEAGAPAEIAQ